MIAEACLIYMVSNVNRIVATAAEVFTNASRILNIITSCALFLESDWLVALLFLLK